MSRGREDRKSEKAIPLGQLSPRRNLARRTPSPSWFPIGDPITYARWHPSRLNDSSSPRHFGSRYTGSISPSSLAVRSPSQRITNDLAIRRSGNVQQVHAGDYRIRSRSAGACGPIENRRNRQCGILDDDWRSYVLGDNLAGLIDFEEEPYREDDFYRPNSHDEEFSNYAEDFHSSNHPATGGTSRSPRRYNTDQPGCWQRRPNRRERSTEARLRESVKCSSGNELLDKLINKTPEALIHIWKFVNEDRRDFVEAYMQILQSYIRRIYIRLSCTVEKEYIQTLLLDFLQKRAQLLAPDTLCFTPYYRAARYETARDESEPDAVTMDKPTFRMPISMIRLSLYMNAGSRSNQLSDILSEMMVEQHQREYSLLTPGAREDLRDEYKRECLRQVDEYLDRRRETVLNRARSRSEEPHVIWEHEQQIPRQQRQSSARLQRSPGQQQPSRERQRRTPWRDRLRR